MFLFGKILFCPTALFASENAILFSSNAGVAAATAALVAWLQPTQGWPPSPGRGPSAMSFDQPGGNQPPKQRCGCGGFKSLCCDSQGSRRNGSFSRRRFPTRTCFSRRRERAASPGGCGSHGPKRAIAANGGRRGGRDLPGGEPCGGGEALLPQQPRRRQPPRNLDLWDRDRLFAARDRHPGHLCAILL